MLRFILIEETAELVVYKYFPENGKDSGAISYYKKTGKFNIIILPEVDKHQRYALKMFSKIREYASADSYQKEGFVTWC